MANYFYNPILNNQCASMLTKHSICMQKMDFRKNSKIKRNYRKNNTRKWAELQISQNFTNLKRIKC